MRLAFLIPFLLAWLYQLVALPLYRLGPVGPDFVLLVVCYLGLHETPRRAIAWALVAGLLVDLISIDPWGVHAMGYVAAAGLLGLGQRGGWSADPFPRLVLAAAAVAVAGACRLAILWDSGRAGAAAELGWALGSAAYSGLLAPCVFALLDPFRRRLVTPRYRRLA